MKEEILIDEKRHDIVWINNEWRLVKELNIHQAMQALELVLPYTDVYYLPKDRVKFRKLEASDASTLE